MSVPERAPASLQCKPSQQPTTAIRQAEVLAAKTHDRMRAVRLVSRSPSERQREGGRVRLSGTRAELAENDPVKTAYFGLE